MKKFVIKRTPPKNKLRPIYEDNDDSSSDEEAAAAAAADNALSGLLKKKKKKINSRFKSSLRKVKKNAAWIKPPDPPVLWNYIDPSDTPPDGYFPMLRNYASTTIVNIKKIKANSDDDDENDDDEVKKNGEDDNIVHEPRVYLFGGTDAFGKDYRTLDHYNLTTNRWIQFDKASFTGKLPRRRHMSAMASANDKILCIFGGKAPGAPEKLRVYECWRKENQRHKRTLKNYNDVQRKLETILEKRKLFLRRDQAKYFDDFHLYHINNHTMINFKTALPVYNAYYNYEMPSKRAGHTIIYMNTFSMTENVTDMIQGFFADGISRDENVPDDEEDKNNSNNEEEEEEDENEGEDANANQSPRSDASDHFRTIPEEEALIKQYRCKGSLLLFGGSASKKGNRKNTRNSFQNGPDDIIECYNDLWRFDLYTMRWFKVKPSGHPPSKTTQHCCTVVGNSMFVYGGVGESSCLWSSMYELKYVKDEWMDFSFVKKKKEKPEETDKRRTMMQAAVNSNPTNIGRFTWVTVQLMPPNKTRFTTLVPPGLANSTMFPSASNHNHIIVFGGRTENGETWRHTEMATFDILKRKWVKSTASRKPPKSRSKHVVALDQRTCTFFLWGDIEEMPGVDIGRFPHESKGAELDRDNKEILKNEEKVMKVLGPTAECLPHVSSPLNGMVKSRLNLWGFQRKSMIDELEVLQASFPSPKYSTVKFRLGRCDKIRKKVHRLTQTMSGAIRRPWTVGQNESKPGTSQSSRSSLRTSQSSRRASFSRSSSNRRSISRSSSRGMSTLSSSSTTLPKLQIDKKKKKKKKLKKSKTINNIVTTAPSATNATTTSTTKTSMKLLNYDTIVSIRSPKGFMDTL